MSPQAVKIWAVVPAGGSGSRFAAPTPKQYQLLAGKSVLEHTLTRLLHVSDELHISVAISDTDQYWDKLDISNHPRISKVSAGKERADSVLSGLRSLQGQAAPEDWVLVHDAARPCVLISDIKRLMNAVAEHSVGGILASAVTDTLKRCDDNDTIVETTDRSRLFQAQTPQAFRYQQLLKALQSACADPECVVTDEASALEYMGFKPLVVNGSRSNIKITYSEDLLMAEAILTGQE